MTISKKTLIHLASYVALVLWAIVIFILSSEGSDASSGRSGAIVQTIQAWGVSADEDILTFLVRKSAHIIAYFIFGILAYNVMRLYSWPMRRAILISASIVLLYAISDEFHQYFVPGRSSEVRDVLIDTTAGIMGISVFALLNARLKAKHLNNRTR